MVKVNGPEEKELQYHRTRWLVPCSRSFVVDGNLTNAMGLFRRKQTGGKKHGGAFSITDKTKIGLGLRQDQRQQYQLQSNQNLDSILSLSSHLEFHLQHTVLRY